MRIEIHATVGLDPDPALDDFPGPRFKSLALDLTIPDVGYQAEHGHYDEPVGTVAVLTSALQAGLEHAIGDLQLKRSTDRMAAHAAKRQAELEQSDQDEALEEAIAAFRSGDTSVMEAMIVAANLDQRQDEAFHGPDQHDETRAHEMANDVVLRMLDRDEVERRVAAGTMDVAQAAWIGY